MAGADDQSEEQGRPDTSAPRGSNQSGMRAYNERLVLSLVRLDGALAKSDIARRTGLSAQTVSVITRGLEADGLLVRGEPVRGRIGQPSVPMSLAADGAYFFGLKIGRRSVDLVLVDLLGRVVGLRRRTYRYPVPGAVVEFAATALPALRDALPPDARGRIGGMGVAMPFQLWDWAEHIDAPPGAMEIWRSCDIAADLAAVSGMPVQVQNDGTAACGAELVFGTGERAADFLYFYIAFFIGGGLVLNGHLFPGRTGNAAGLGPMPVPGPDGRVRRLMRLASLVTLEESMRASGEDPGQLWTEPEGWRIAEPILDGWIAGAAEGMAHAALSAVLLLELDTVVIDGWMPGWLRTRLTEATRAAFLRLDLAGLTAPPTIREGTLGPQARELGAAAVPLSQRFLLDQTGMGKAG